MGLRGFWSSSRDRALEHPSATICLVTHFKSSCRASPSLLVRLGVLMSPHRRYSPFVRSLSPSIRTLFARSMGRCGMAAAILVNFGHGLLLPSPPQRPSHAPAQAPTYEEDRGLYPPTTP